MPFCTSVYVIAGLLTSMVLTEAYYSWKDKREARKSLLNKGFKA